MAAYKYNDNADFQSGQFIKNTETGAMKINNQDNVVYLAELGRTISSFSTDVMDSKHLATQLMQQSQREKSVLESQGKELVKKGEALKEKVVEQMEEKKESVTQEAATKIDSALAHIEALQEHGRETTSNLRKRLFKNIPKKR